MSAPTPAPSRQFVLVLPSGNDDDREKRIGGGERPKNVPAAVARQAEVQQHEVNPLRVEYFEALMPVSGQQDFISFSPQNLA